MKYWWFRKAEPERTRAYIFTKKAGFVLSCVQEECYICTIESLEETAAKHGIIKTALILVGDVIAHRGYEKSSLYAPDFSTEFRQAKE